MRKQIQFLFAALSMTLLLSLGQAGASTQQNRGDYCHTVWLSTYFDSYDIAIYELGMTSSQAGAYANAAANRAYDQCKRLAPQN